MKQQAVLREVFGDNVGRAFVLDLPLTLIGRSTRADLQLTQESISRRHAEISRLPGAYWLSDRRSRNGTFVNDVPVDRHELKEGDLVKVGRTILKFTFRSDDDDHGLGGPGGSGGGGPPPPSAAAADDVVTAAPATS